MEVSLKKKVITIRTTEQQYERLERLAKKQRMKTGEAFTVAQIIREAIEEKLSREE